MFPRNENRNEGTFAKATLLETALLSPNDPFLVLTKGWFPKGWFRRMFPRNENRNENRNVRQNHPFTKPPFYLPVTFYSDPNTPPIRVNSKLEKAVAVRNSLLEKFAGEEFRHCCQSSPKGAGKLVPRENCRKVSKIFLTLFDDF